MRTTSFFLDRAQHLWSHLSWNELSGSVGDLGTFIPIFIALVQSNKIHPTPALFWAGVANVITGCTWDIPMPVQPMKSIATTALIDQLTDNQVAAAGIWMGLLLFVLAPLMDRVHRIVPQSVVSGLQMGVGLSLAMKGLHLLDGMKWIGPQVDCLALAILAAAAAFYLLKEEQPSSATSSSNDPTTVPTNIRCSPVCQIRRPAPVGLYLFGLGSILALVNFQPTTWEIQSLIHIPTYKSSDWIPALLQGALPQLPLTTLNSVISVCSLANTLYKPHNPNGDREQNVMERQHVCRSVAILNLVLCPLGALPVCHGAGGLAGQHHFGARHGTAVVVLGVAKIVLAVGGGSWFVAWITALPTSIVSVLLVVAGLELAVTGMTTTISNNNNKRDPTVALVTTACSLGWHATHYGALAGWAVHWLLEDDRGDDRSTTPYGPVEQGDPDDDSVFIPEERLNTPDDAESSAPRTTS